VLLLGDGTAACDSVVKMLHRLEMDAEVLLSVQEAVQKLEQGSYAAVLLFHRNVDEDALRMIGKLRDAASAETPLLMLSSCNGEEPEEKVVQAGATAFCGQPVFMSDLCRVLLELMSRGEDGGNAAAEMGLESFEGKRILLAEDNELNCEIATEVLQSYGFAVETAENGKVALEMVENSAPGYYDVVLMDIQMPVMDGYTAARAIRSLTNPELANVPILAMTANAFEEDRQNSLNAGMNGHITKPLDMEVLLEVLRQHL
jgi:CheY-like chemotaxis protein